MRSPSVRLDLKQPYCRDLRDCQTYFPCAVFSSGFSYLYVIKRCQNAQIFDEKKQKCVKNTLKDPTCAKQSFAGKGRLTTSRTSPAKSSKRADATPRKRAKIPLRAPSVDTYKRKNVETRKTEQRTLREDNDEEPVPESTTEEMRREEEMRSKMHRVCYVTNWSRYRSGEAKFELEYIDPFMCSHIIYAYATVDDEKPEIVPVQKEDIGKQSDWLIAYDFVRCSRALPGTGSTEEDQSESEDIHPAGWEERSLHAALEEIEHGSTARTEPCLVG